MSNKKRPDPFNVRGGAGPSDGVYFAACIAISVVSLALSAAALLMAVISSVY